MTTLMIRHHGREAFVIDGVKTRDAAKPATVQRTTDCGCPHDAALEKEIRAEITAARKHTRDRSRIRSLREINLAARSMYKQSTADATRTPTKINSLAAINKASKSLFARSK